MYQYISTVWLLKKHMPTKHKIGRYTQIKAKFFKKLRKIFIQLWEAQ